jgi:hypothetical protein
MQYMLILISEEGNQDDATPEQVRQQLGAWNEYTESLRGAGAFVSGDGLQPSATATTVELASAGDHVVTDGPFAETKEQIGGYYIIECADLDEALEWAKKVPMAPGGSIEVRPVIDYSQFGEQPAAQGSAAS